MPNEHLPGPRACFKPDAMVIVASRNPRLLRKRANGRPNISAIARYLHTTPGTLNKMVNGRLPVNLQVITALVASQGSWNAAAEILDVFDENGERIEIADCNCAADTALVPA
jgi:hypothetical protein